MEKILFLGDTHGRNTWRQIIEKEKPTKVIFVGDYFDSFNISGIEQLTNFQEIINFKLSNTCETILLIGNHDFHYLDVGETYSGFQHRIRWDINKILKDNLNLLQIAYKFDNILCTHAGVSSVFMNNTFGENGWGVGNIDILLNEQFQFKPISFCFDGFDPYGNNTTQTPIWIRQPALCKANRNHPIKKQLIQIFGHTQVKEINLEEQNKFLGGRYYMIDSIEFGYYLIFENGKFIAKQL
jgi:predicted phosphodiesterase